MIFLSYHLANFVILLRLIFFEISFPLLKLIKKGNTDVKIASLEAIGQSRDSFYIPYLLKIINHKRKQKIKPAALVALGKCITKSKVDKLVAISNSDQPGYAECIYRAMLKGVGEKSLTDKMVNTFLYPNTRDNQFYAAWYFARTPYKLSSENYLNLSSHYSSDIAIPLFIALGKVDVKAKDSLIIWDMVTLQTLLNFTIRQNGISRI